MKSVTAVTTPDRKSRRRPTVPGTPEAATKTSVKNIDCEAEEASLQRQLSLLVLIRCLRTAQLAPPPIIVSFYQNSCNLEPSTILWLGSWYSALAAICEMPSGLLSDVFGRKLTLQLAFIGMGTCYLVTYGGSLSSSSSSSMILIWLGLAQLLRALGSTLYSGTDMALLYELLKKYRKRQSEKATDGDDLALKLESRQVVLSTITEAVVAALGGLLSRLYGDSVVILMSTVPPIAGAMICLGLEETASIEDDMTTKVEKASSQTNHSGGDDHSNAAKSPSIPKRKKFERKQSIVNALIQPSLHVIFAVGVILNCGTYVAATALNPLLWQQVGITNFAGGFLQATNSGMTALGALAAPALKRNCDIIGRKALGSEDDGTYGLLLLLLSTSSLAYGIMTWNAFNTTPVLVSLIHTSSTIGASWLLSLVRGLAWPVLGSALNATIGENGTRATVLSLFAGAIKIGMVFTGFALGSILHKSSSLGNACALCTSLLIAAVFGYVAGFREMRSDGMDSIVANNDKKDN